MCAKAFECDRCDDVQSGRPYQRLAWGPTADSAKSRAERESDTGRDLCEECWASFMDYIEGRPTTGVRGGGD